MDTHIISLKLKIIIFVNDPGSIGQNRNDIKKIEFAILDTNSLQADFYSESWLSISNKRDESKNIRHLRNYYLSKLKWKKF